MNGVGNITDKPDDELTKHSTRKVSNKYHLKHEAGLVIAVAQKNITLPFKLLVDLFETDTPLANF